MLSHGEVAALLPHGHPMRLVDRVLALTPGVSLLAIKAVTASEPCYAPVPAGLPADRYAYPTSLLLESFGQAAAILWLVTRSLDPGTAAEPDTVMLAAARECRIVGRAYPGDVIHHRVRLTHSRPDTALAEGEALVDDRLVAQVGTFIAVARPTASLVPREDRPGSVPAASLTIGVASP